MTQLWTSLTPDDVLQAMPTDMATLYAQWIDVNPDRATRLADLTEETVTVCRAAVAARYPDQLDPDETAVPAAGYRHMMNLVIFNLGMEMGVDFAAEVYSLFNRADIWLRGIQNGSIALADLETSATPSYSQPDSARTLEG